MLNILLLTFIFASNIKASHDSTEKNIPYDNSNLNSGEKIQLTPSQIVSTAKDSVAQIYAFKKGISVSPFSGDYQMDPFWDNFFKGFLKDFEKEKIHSGSGFLISIEGEEGTYVVTCNHVVQNANKIIIKIENKIYLTKLVYRELDSDIAILKVESKDKLPVLELGDSHSISSGDEGSCFRISV
jgi:S1-C subfamily serine protease